MGVHIATLVLIKIAMRKFMKRVRMKRANSYIWEHIISFLDGPNHLKSNSAFSTFLGKHPSNSLVTMLRVSKMHYHLAVKRLYSLPVKTNNIPLLMQGSNNIIILSDRITKLDALQMITDLSVQADIHLDYVRYFSGMENAIKNGYKDFKDWLKANGEGEYGQAEALNGVWTRIAELGKLAKRQAYQFKEFQAVLRPNQLKRFTSGSIDDINSFVHVIRVVDALWKHIEEEDNACNWHWAGTGCLPEIWLHLREAMSINDSFFQQAHIPHITLYPPYIVGPKYRVQGENTVKIKDERFYLENTKLTIVFRGRILMNGEAVPLASSLTYVFHQSHHTDYLLREEINNQESWDRTLKKGRIGALSGCQSQNYKSREVTFIMVRPGEKRDAYQEMVKGLKDNIELGKVDFQVLDRFEEV